MTVVTRRRTLPPKRRQPKPTDPSQPSRRPVTAAPGQDVTPANTGRTALGPQAAPRLRQPTRTSVRSTSTRGPGYDAALADAAVALALALTDFGLLLINRCRDNVVDAVAEGRSAAVEDVLTDCTMPGRAPTRHRLPVPQATAVRASDRPPVITLDPAALARTAHETTQASALLASIFTETPAGAPSPTPTPTPTPQRPDGARRQAGKAASAGAARTDQNGPGLDATHRVLLDSLMSSAGRSQTTFTELCARHDLLPRGAAAVLNEAAQLACGEPLLDGTDPYELNDFALHEMTHAG